MVPEEGRQRLCGGGPLCGTAQEECVYSGWLIDWHFFWIWASPDYLGPPRNAYLYYRTVMHAVSYDYITKTIADVDCILILMTILIFTVLYGWCFYPEQFTVHWRFTFYHCFCVSCEVKSWPWTKLLAVYATYYKWFFSSSILQNTALKFTKQPQNHYLSVFPIKLFGALHIVLFFTELYFDLPVSSRASSPADCISTFHHPVDLTTTCTCSNLAPFLEIYFYCRAYPPFVHNANVFLCTALSANKRGLIASAEIDGVEGIAGVVLKAGRGTLFWPGREYYVETRCWEMFPLGHVGPSGATLT